MMKQVIDVVGVRPGKMVPWIDRLLEKWARWSTAQGWHGGGSGVSSLLLTDHIEIDHAVRLRDSPSDLMIDIDQAVSCLPDELRDVVRERYERGGLVTQKARALGISERTFKYRVSKVHAAIEAALSVGPSKVDVLRVKWYAQRCRSSEMRLAA